MRLIDADALIEENKTIIDCEIDHPKYQDTVREIIDSAPTIELVRCKECRWYKDFDGCFFSTAEVEEDGFCSYGEKQTERSSE